MKRILLFLVLISFAFAQQTGSGPQSIKGALTDLCATSSQTAMISAIILIFIGIAFVAVGFFLFKIMKTENKTIRIAGMVVLAFGALILLGGIISFISYLLIPSSINSLTGVTLGTGACS